MPQRREDAQRHAHSDRKDHRRGGQLQRRRQPLRDVQRDGTMRKRTLAKVEMHRLPSIEKELPPDRRVESVLMPDLRDLLRRRRVARHRHSRVRGHQMDQHERQD